MSYTSQEKWDSREALFALYRTWVAPRLPAGKQYWTLSSTQPRVGSEIAQIVDSGLIKPPQFHGVDRDPKLIKQNLRWWPQANWYCGDLFQCILSAKYFNPGLVFYDSTSTPVLDELYRNVAFIMSRCPARTMVCVNVMLNDAHPPYRKHSENMFIERLANCLMSDWDIWGHDVQHGCYRQKGKKANMGMYAFVSK